MGKLKLPGIPSHILPKYRHEIQCVLSQFQSDILCDILKHAGLDDNAFIKITRFSDFGCTPTGVLKMIKDIKGNDVSKRLYEIRTGKTESEE